MYLFGNSRHNLSCGCLQSGLKRKPEVKYTSRGCAWSLDSGSRKCRLLAGPQCSGAAEDAIGRNLTVCSPAFCLSRFAAPSKGTALPNKGAHHPCSMWLLYLSSPHVWTPQLSERLLQADACLPLATVVPLDAFSLQRCSVLPPEVYGLCAIACPTEEALS